MLQNSRKQIHEQAWLGRKDNSLGIVQETIESILENETLKVPWDFEIQMDNLILARRPDSVLISKKKRNCQRTTKGKWKKVKIFANTWILPEAKKLWNIKLTVIPIVVGAPRMAHKDLNKRQGKQETRRRIKTIKTTVVTGSARILRRVLESPEESCKKTPVKIREKSSRAE